MRASGSKDLCHRIIGAAAVNPRACPRDSASFNTVYEIGAILVPRAETAAAPAP
jgi:hypothetical protein